MEETSPIDDEIKAPTPKESWRLLPHHWLWIPAIVAFLIYLPTLGHEGVIDDRLLILDNPYLQTFSGLFDLWTRDLWEASAMHASAQYYRPLPMTLYWFQILLFGPKLWWLRLGNILMFAGAAAILPRLLLRSNPKLGIPWATTLALCWTLHPLHSEAVIWLSGRFDTLVLLLSLGTLFCNTDERRGRLVPWLLALALLTKEVGIALFPAILVGDFVKHGRWDRCLQVEGKKWLVSGLVVGAYLVLRRALGIYGATDIILGISPAVVLSGFADLSITYAKLTVLPLGLDVHHWSTARSLSVAIAVLITHGLLCGGAFILARKHQAGTMIAGCTLTLLSMMLASNVGPSQHVFGDRFWTLASVGLVLVLAQVLENREPLRRTWMVLGFVTSAVLGVLTVLRGTDWASEERLAERTLAQEPNHPHWLVISAHQALRRGQIEEARGRLERVLQIEPNMGKAHNALCVTEMRAGRLDLAEKECRRAIALMPDHASAWLNLASVYVNAKRYEDTRNAAEKALSIQPQNAEAEYLLAIVFANLEAFDEARKPLARGLAISPRHPGLRKLEAQLGSSSPQ
jgi:tetratricopeptide (TPR) repeat protein